ncbi:u3 small nucleolar RNA-associated protein 11 [Flagelloscypha sp. PMI_526]|nr:u3 small nucleolar RNA-associated protein 11 [Flagelloscypha sp. PMI_526]
MTSSLRNSLHRRNHKERGQLANRSRLGILEKHSDYVKRARDFHAKQDRITRLKQKAAERNKDEFYFSMKKEKTKKGVHIKDRGNAAIPTDIVKVLKTQDEGYIRTMRTKNLKRIDQLKQSLMTMPDLLQDLSRLRKAKELSKEDLEVLKTAGILSKAKLPKVTSSHIRFDQSGERRSGDQESFSDHSRISSEDEELGWTTELSSSTHTAPTIQQPEESREDLSTEKSVLSLVNELSARLFRDKQLCYTIREFELQRSMMGKGARKKIEAGGMDDNDLDDN